MYLEKTLSNKPQHTSKLTETKLPWTKYHNLCKRGISVVHIEIGKWLSSH